MKLPYVLLKRREYEDLLGLNKRYLATRNELETAKRMLADAVEENRDLAAQLKERETV